jgi:hypothetical protein
MSEWHYSSNGQQLGPVNSAQLKQLAASGQLQASDMVWKDGMADWAPASRIKGLFAGAAAPTSSGGGGGGGGGGTAVETIPVAPPAARPAAAVAHQHVQQTQDTFPSSQQPASPIGYYNPVGGLSERVARTLNGFPPPSGMQGEWPLTEMHLAQLKEAEKQRKSIRNCGGFMGFLCAMWAIFGVLFAVGGSFILNMGPRGATPTWASGFVMGFASIFIGLAVLAFFARRATLRCRVWAPITFTVLMSIGMIINIASAMMNSGTSPGLGSGPNIIGIVVALAIGGAFLSVFVKAMLAIPKFLACPLWAQEALVNAKL